MPPKYKIKTPKRTMEAFLAPSSAPDTKRVKLNMFREVVGTGVSESVAMDCLSAASGDLESAVNIYFNGVRSMCLPIELEVDSPAPAPRPEPVSRFIECIPVGSILCSGSLTSKLSAASNELYMDTPLNCSFSIRPPTGSHPNTPTELLDVIHGSGFIRFSLPTTRSEIGRIPAPLAAALCPLVKLGFAEVSLSVGFPGCAGLNLTPGASVPIRVDVAVTPDAMKRMRSSAADDLLIERIAGCWETVLKAMNIEVASGVQETASAEPEAVSVASSVNSADGDIEMSDEMHRFVEVFARPELGQMRPPQNIFPTRLKFYQAQALLWMASREYPPELGGVPADITAQLEIEGDIPSGQPDQEGTIPSIWTKISTGEGTLYYHDGFFQTERPPPVVECRGGLLADEMGLGKTVMTLALVSLDLLGDRFINSSVFQAQNEPLRGGTLIVVHLSLLNQWVNELKRHCPNLTYLEFHGSDRTFDPNRLAAVDVVFSTYGTVSVNIDQSPLLAIAWTRIVLDEAHTIRTRSTKMSKAVSKLNAERRWCLSGTPLQNSIEDIYPLVAWLRVPQWRSYAYFRKEVVARLEIPSNTSPGMSEGLVNARTMLGPIMIRRTKTTRGLDGKPLVELPPRRNKIVYISMSDEEKDFYRALFWQTKLEFDKFEKSNAVMFNITHVLQLIIRLRQALCHPLLCRNAIANHEHLLEGTTQGVDSLDALLQKFLLKNSASKEYLENAIEDIKRLGVGNLECPICLCEPCQFPVMTPCGHTMCRKCAISRLRGECPICRHVFINTDLQNINHLVATEDTNNPLMKSAAKASICPPLSSKLRTLLDHLARDMRLGRRVIVFSQFVSFIDIIAKAFDSKNIPYRTLHGAHSTSQRDASIEWLNNADLSGQENDWVNHISEGLVDVSENELEEAEHSPSERGQGRVLLVSLKAGGVGLNLVSANVVYLTDLWWNPATEEQAFQRVHRLGQTRKTITYKFVCKDTIDERILDLQATKSDMTADVLGYNQIGSGLVGRATNKKLTLEDIRQLFKPTSSSS